MKKKCNWWAFLKDKGLFKIVVAMKFMMLFFLMTVHVYGTVYSQSTRLTVEMDNATTIQVLEEIENQTDYKFLYNDELINGNEYHSIKIKNKTVEDVLDQILAGTGSTYSVMSNHLIVIKPGYSDIEQSGRVKGTVTSSSGESLIGVTIVEKGTTNGTVSDFDGNYSLEVGSMKSTLVFTFIGYKTIEVGIESQGTINVSMEEDVVGLDEVVVVGYGSVKKSDLTGSVSTVKADDIAAYPSLGAVQSLQGRAAGVQIQSNNGEPGSGVKVRIRGATSVRASSDPLYVVDGFPGAVLPPPEDIESVEVLKDASATAIYGSRGANGVIIVTTKRGQKGKTKIELNSSYSIQNEINRLDLLNKDQFVDMINEVDPSLLDGTIVGSGTDWQEEIFRTGHIQNHQLSVSGGNDDVRYYVSGIVYDQDGVIHNSNYQRYSVTSNLDVKATEKFSMGLNLFARRTIKDGVRTQEGSGGTGGTGVVAAAYTGEPTLPVYNEDGSYTISWLGDPNDNPVAIMNERSNENVQDRLQANFYGEYAFLPELKFRMTLGATINNSRTGSYTPTTLNAGRAVGGSGQIDAGKYTALINENYLTYNKNFDGHDISVMGGYSFQSTNSESWTARNQTFLTDAFLWWDLDGGSNLQAPASGLTKTQLTSFYGRVNYKLFDRYLLTLNARYDGSSRFAKNNKWAFFPSGALAWNIAEESFMESVRQISQLKLRVSYGVTGNQAIGAYESLAKFRTVHSVQNSSIVNAVRPNAVANDNLTWESTGQFDVGIDLGLLDQRIYLVADYYQQKTTDLLFPSPLPQYSGYSSLMKNIGSLQNKGFEATLSTVNLNGDFKWTTDLNFSMNRNKVLELPDGNDIFYRVLPGHMVGVGSTNVLREGEPVGVFYGYVYDGVYQEGETILPGNFDQFAGGEKYKDIDGIRNEEGELTGEADGKIGGDDRTIIGNPQPDFIWGMSNRFEYKGFDLNIFFQGTQGNDIYSFTLMELETLRGISNSTTEALNRWSPSNTNTDVPKADLSRGYHESSRWVYDGSYIRLKNLALGYTFPRSAVSKLGLGGVRVYVSGQNILTFTKYRGYDPEVNYNSEGSQNGNRNLGFDYGSYPNAKSYTLGLKVTF